MLLYSKLPGEQPTRIMSDNIAVEVSKTSIDNLQRNIETMNGGQIQLPDNLFDFGDKETVINSRVFYYISPLILYSYFLSEMSK